MFFSLRGLRLGIQLGIALFAGTAILLGGALITAGRKGDEKK